MSHHQPGVRLRQRLAEGNPVGRLEFGQRRVEACAKVVRVGLDAPETGEMLHGAGDAECFEAAQIGDRDVSCNRGVAGDRAPADQAMEVERIAGPVSQQIDDRCKIQRDAEARQFAAMDPTKVFRLPRSLIRRQCRQGR